MWNYRIMKTGKCYGLFECYYDDDGRINGWTQDPEFGVFESPEDIRGAVELMHRDTQKDSPILDWDESVDNNRKCDNIKI